MRRGKKHGPEPEFIEEQIIRAGLGGFTEGDFPPGTVVKNLPANAGDTRDVGSIPVSVRKIPRGEEMTIHCSILAWKISRTEEPGGLPSMGSQRVGHD